MSAEAPRIAVVVHDDEHGEIGERVELQIADLRSSAECIVLAVGRLAPAARVRAEALADRVVLARPSSRIALAAAALDALADEGELAAGLLVTDTQRYAPLPTAPMPAPATGAWTWVATAPRHELEPSLWVAVDADTARSAAWRQWWREARDDRGALGLHDLVQHLDGAGIRVRPLREPRDERIERGTLEDPAGHPFVERVLLTADPIALEDRALDAPAAWRRLREAGYPMDVAARDLRRAAPPRQIATATGALAILAPQAALRGRAPRLGVLAHVFYPEALPELARPLQQLPGDWSLIVTTGSAETKSAIEGMVPAVLGDRGPVEVEVRVAASNRGRDISAFLIGCRDVLRPGADGSYRFDVVLKLHSKRSPQDPFPRAAAFQRHVMGSLLGAEGEAVALVQRFVDEPELGIAMPPQIHVGYPTLGRAWFGNRPAAERLARRLGIDVPFDDGSPLAPFGSMFAARPAALRPLVDALDWDDFPDESGYRDGGLAHVVERLFAYTAIAEGYTARTVTTARIAAESHQMLEWKLQRILEDVPGTARQQVLLARAATRTAASSLGAVVRSGRALAGTGARTVLRLRDAVAARRRRRT